MHRDISMCRQRPAEQQAKLSRLLTPVPCQRRVQTTLEPALRVPFGFTVANQVNFGGHPQSSRSARLLPITAANQRPRDRVKEVLCDWCAAGKLTRSGPAKSEKRSVSWAIVASGSSNLSRGF